MESLWKVWFSRRRKVYVRIARQYGSTPWRVYYLGHEAGAGRSKTCRYWKRYSGRELFRIFTLGDN